MIKTDWKNWFAKPHKTAIEDTMDGRRDDYVALIFPKYQKLTFDELQAKSSDIFRILLQSRFQAFLVCTKHILLSPCKEHDSQHYRSYQGIEIGVPLCEKGKLLEFLHSLNFDFNEDCVVSECHTETKIQCLPTFNVIFHASRSRNHSHFFMFNPEYSVDDWSRLAAEIQKRAIRLTNELHELPKMSIETIWVYQLDEIVADTYLEVMMSFNDARKIYIVLSSLCQLTYDKYSVHTAKSIPLSFFSYDVTVNSDLTA